MSSCRSGAQGDHVSPTLARVRYERARSLLGNDHPRVRALHGRVLATRAESEGVLINFDGVTDVGFWRARGLAGYDNRHARKRAALHTCSVNCARALVMSGECETYTEAFQRLTK